MLFNILTNCQRVFACGFVHVVIEDSEFTERSSVFAITQPARVELWVPELHNVLYHLLPGDPDVPDWPTQNLCEKGGNVVVRQNFRSEYVVVAVPWLCGCQREGCHSCNILRRHKRDFTITCRGDDRRLVFNGWEMLLLGEVL